MLSIWAKHVAVYVGDGRLLVSELGSQPSLRSMNSTSGTECELLESLVTAHPNHRFDLLLGSPWVKLAAVMRVSGVWRRGERDRAASAKLGVDERQYAIVTADPAVDSAWIAHVVAASMRARLDDLTRRHPGRIGSVRSFVSALASEVPARSAENGLLTVLEGTSLSWVVRAHARVIDAGCIDGVDRGQLKQECARLAMRHAVRPAHVNAFDVRVSDPLDSRTPLRRGAAATRFAVSTDLASDADDAV